MHTLLAKSKRETTRVCRSASREVTNATPILEKGRARAHTRTLAGAYILPNIKRGSQR